MEIDKCLNEWNVIVEALGHGYQTILIRKYPTKNKNFILYPTTSYTLKDNFFGNFKKKYQNFVKDNSLPKSINKMNEIKYFANVQAIFEKTPQRIAKLNKFHMWKNTHVKAYLNNANGFVWVLRVYKLDNPVMSDRSKSLIFSNLRENINIDHIEPVLTDSEFAKIVQEIE